MASIFGIGLGGRSGSLFDNLSKDEIDTVVNTVIGEAANQGAKGMAAVASVIRNRAAEKGKSPAEIVAEPHQFAAFSNPGAKVQKDMQDPALRAEATQIVQSIFSGDVSDPTDGADHYHADSVTPDWANSMAQTTKIGDHIFYRSGDRRQPIAKVEAPGLPSYDSLMNSFSPDRQQTPPALRPFKSSERVDNPDGTYSTERSVTYQTPDGKWVNVPSLWMSQNGPVNLAGDETKINGVVSDFEAKTGKQFPRFPDLKSAEEAAKARSAAGGAGVGSLADEPASPFDTILTPDRRAKGLAGIVGDRTSPESSSEKPAPSAPWLQYDNSSAVRNLPLSPKLTTALSTFLPEMGVTVKVFSGGQAKLGTSDRRTGSVRHDDGDAGDMLFYKDGRQLDWANPQDRPIFEEIVSRGHAAGITGFGAGPGYMRPGSMHVGFGTPRVWGAGGHAANAPGWLKNAYGTEPTAKPVPTFDEAQADAGKRSQIILDDSFKPADGLKMFGNGATMLGDIQAANKASTDAAQASASAQSEQNRMAGFTDMHNRETDATAAQMNEQMPGRYVSMDPQQADQFQQDWQTKNQSSGTAGDTVRNWTIGAASGAQQLSNVNRLIISKLPYGDKINATLDSIDRWFSGGMTSDEINRALIEKEQSELSPEGKAAAEKKWWNGEKGTFGPAWSDPRSYLGMAAQSAPSTIATMLPSGMMARGAYLGKIAAGAAPEIAAAAAAKTATIAGGLGEGFLGGAQSAQTVKDEIAKMPRDQLEQSDAVKALMSQGMSSDQAIAAISSDAQTQAFLVTGVTTGIFGGLGDRTLAKILAEGVGGGVVKRAVRGMIRGAISEGVLEELPQNVTQQMSENAAIQKVDPNRSLMQDVPEAAMSGLAGGVAMGGPMGAGAGIVSKAEPTHANTTAPANEQSAAAPVATAPAPASTQTPPQQATQTPTPTDNAVGDVEYIRVNPDGTDAGAPTDQQAAPSAATPQTTREAGPIGRSVGHAERSIAERAQATQTGAPAPNLQKGVTVRVDQPGIDPFMGTVDSLEGNEAIIMDASTGELLQVPVEAVTQIAASPANIAAGKDDKSVLKPKDALPETSSDPALEPAAPKAADVTTEPLPPPTQQRPATERFPSAPLPGERVIVDDGNGGRFAATVKTYENGGKEAVVQPDQGDPLQVPTDKLFISNQTPAQVEAEDMKRNPPVPRDVSKAGPNARNVNGKTVVMPDDVHARLFDLGRERNLSKKMMGASQLDLGGVGRDATAKLATDMGISPEAVGTLADDYRYRVERSAKNAQYAGAIKMPEVDPRRLRQWQRDQEKATGAASPAIDSNAEWWDGELTAQARRKMLDAAGVKRSEKLRWAGMTPAIREKLLAQRAPASPSADSTEDRKASTTTFTTAKGSVYQVDANGRTTRDKAKRDDPGHENDFGRKKTSQRTVYVKTNASVLSSAGLSGIGEKGSRVIIKDGKASLLTWNAKENRWGVSPQSRDIEISDTPDIGAYPLELWDRRDDVPGYEAYANMHAGNSIVSIEKGSAQQATTVDDRTHEAATSPRNNLPEPTEASPPRRVWMGLRGELAKLGYSDRQLDQMSDQQVKDSATAMSMVRKDAEYRATSMPTTDGSDWALIKNYRDEITNDVAAGRVILPENPIYFEPKKRSSHSIKELEEAEKELLEWARMEGITENEAIEAVREEIRNGKIRDEKGVEHQALIDFMEKRRTIDGYAHQAATSPHNALPEPTPDQKHAGNYKLGHIKLGGLDISIENPAGSTRSGVDGNGKPWSVDMKSHYGYIKGTVGRDKDHVDIFVKPGTAELEDSSPVYVVDQISANGRFDEHKVMAGFDSADAARQAYLENYTKDWKGLGALTETTLGSFKEWLANGDTTKKFAATQSTPNPATTKAATPAAAVSDIVDADKTPSSKSAKAQEARAILAGVPDGGTVKFVGMGDDMQPGAWRVEKIGNNGQATLRKVFPGAQPTTFSLADLKRETRGDGRFVADGTSKPVAPARKPKPAPYLDRYENYFRPGRDVPSYMGTDRVESFDRGQDSMWSVKVRAVNKDGSLGHLRTHSTAPNERELAKWERENPVPPRKKLPVSDNTVTQENAAEKAQELQQRKNAEEPPRMLEPVADKKPDPKITRIERGFISRRPPARAADESLAFWAKNTVLNAGQKTGHEYLVAIDDDGSIVEYGTDRQPDRTGISPKLAGALWNPDRRVAIYHNHPRNTPISAPDIAMLAYPGAYLIVANGHKGRNTSAGLTAASQERARQIGYHSLLNLITNARRDLVNEQMPAALDASEKDAIFNALPAEISSRAGIIDFEDNMRHDFSRIPEFETAIDRAAETLKRDFHGSEAAAREADARLDRSPKPLRHIGSVENVAQGTSEPTGGRSGQGSLAEGSARNGAEKDRRELEQNYGRVAATRDNIISAVKGAIEDKNPSILATVPLNYFPELANGKLPAIDDYLLVKRKMDAYRSDRHEQAAAIIDKWRKYISLGFFRNNQAKAAHLSALMHDSTLAGIDPSEDRSKLSVEEQKTKSPTDPKYVSLRARYLEMPPLGRQLFQEVRDAYREQADETDRLLLDNIRKAQEVAKKHAERDYKARIAAIEAEDANPIDKRRKLEAAKSSYDAANTRSEWASKARMTTLRRMFESNRVEDPYFPLSRFGDYFASVRGKSTVDQNGVIVPGPVMHFGRYESKAEMDRALRDLKSEFDGKDVEITSGRLSKSGEIKSAMDPKVVGEIDRLLQNSGVGNDIRDALYQRWLETMPDLSMRKRAIHRKGTAGFNTDAYRVYASTAFHAGHQMARLKYGVELQENVNQAEEQAKAIADNTREMALVNELQLRHQWVKNPQSGSLVNWLTSLGFVYYMGVSPAAAVVNASQTWMVGLPVIGSRFGFGKSTAALLKASHEFLGAVRNEAKSAKGAGQFLDQLGDLRNTPGLSADDKAAMDAFYQSGLIDRTQSHDLASIGETGTKYNPLRAKLMKVASWSFHKVEVYNRSVTALATYRLAREAGQSHLEAINTAHTLTYAAHFDMSNSSRPRITQNDTMRALTMFRSFQINMLFRIGRDMYQAVKAESPQARREARWQLAGITGMMALNAGLTGTIGYGFVMAAAEIIRNLFGDDDDPLSFEERFKADVMDILGPRLGGIVLKGVPGELLGIDLTSRIGMPDFWLRSSDRELDGDNLWNYWVEQTAGAGVALGHNFYKGIGMMMDGKVERGIENIVPKFVRDMMRAGRYSVNGVETLRGDEILPAESINWRDLAAQTLGFTPAKIDTAFEINNVMKNAEKRMTDKRKEIVNGFAEAVENEDSAARVKAMEKIRKYNASPINRLMPITSQGVKQSLATRARNRAKMVNGVLIKNKALSNFLQDQVSSQRRAAGEDDAEE